MGGLTFPCENGKSEGVGGVLFEIPSVVGVWIFSGTTHLKSNHHVARRGFEPSAIY